MYRNTTWLVDTDFTAFRSTIIIVSPKWDMHALLAEKRCRAVLARFTEGIARWTEHLRR